MEQLSEQSNESLAKTLRKANYGTMLKRPTQHQLIMNITWWHCPSSYANFRGYTAIINQYETNSGKKKQKQKLTEAHGALALESSMMLEQLMPFCYSQLMAIKV